MGAPVRRLNRRSGSFLLLTAASALFAVAVVALADVSSAGAPAGRSPIAGTAVTNPTVGPLFPAGMGANHTCTAGVLTVGQGLLLTAAHCVTGTGAGMLFVPGYDGTAADPTPYGVWSVSRVWMSPEWVTGQDAQHDYAIVQVADRIVDGRVRSVDSVTGGSAVSLTQQVGAEVTVPAYPAGLGDAPITCSTTTFGEQGFFGFRCAGYFGGTSGAPWFDESGDPAAGSVIMGVVGGLHQGGCDDAVSYSPYFGGDLLVLEIRALLDFPGDNGPVPGDDGC